MNRPGAGTLHLSKLHATGNDFLVLVDTDGVWGERGGEQRGSVLPRKDWEGRLWAPGERPSRGRTGEVAGPPGPLRSTTLI